MRTGFGIAALAGTFKKFWIMTFGLIMIIMSSLQYVSINNSLETENNPKNMLLDKVPLIYVFLSLGALFLQFNR